MKSSLEDLKKRGFVDEDYIIDHHESGIDNASLVKGLKSSIPTERTKAAMLIQKMSLDKCIPELIEALKKESKLYTKIAISRALAGFNKNSVRMLIPCLGSIGKNQHKTLPTKPFNKDSYPLPRDIVARILVNIKDTVVSEIVTADLSAVQIREAVDVLGHISYYSKDKSALPCLLKYYDDNSHDQVIRWKILRAFSAFDDEEVRSLLVRTIEKSAIEAFIREARRSLRLINIRSGKSR